MSELEYELTIFDRTSSSEVDGGWERVCECGDRFVPEWPRQSRCTYCFAVKQDIDL